MSEFSKRKNNILDGLGEYEYNQEVSAQETSNPLAAKKSTNIALTNYSQEINRPKYDNDIKEILEVVRIINNLAPLRMPIYNFNLDEINGDRYFKPDGSLLLVREFDSDVIRDYYVTQPKENCIHSISRILEHDKTTGRLKTKIEPINRNGSRVTTNITIFDSKINNKYIIMQLSEGGIVNNISEFTGKGKSFQTLFRNIETFKPARYIEGKDNKENGFFMTDCIFDSNGNIARIKRYNSKQEICIDYTKDKKNITVKTNLS